MRAVPSLVALVVAVAACGGGDDGPQLSLIAVTFNTGTTDGLDHDGDPDDGYGSDEATLSDMYYGDGLAWSAVIDDTRAFLAEVGPDVIGFQEIFHPGDCAGIPEAARAGFVCESWTDGDPTVAQMIVGAGYQVACHPGKTDKCIAVKRTLGSLRGCDGDLCLDGLDGGEVSGCGSGSRVGRGIIDLAGGGELTVVNIHGTSGFTADDEACRTAQFDQVFVDLGDGAPAASGEANLILGDLNTDPGRLAGSDPSATRFADHVAGGFQFVTEVGEEATPTYQGALNIDHIVSDRFRGDCWAAGVADRPPVTEIVYFDHLPVVCAVSGPLP